jgi:hypothetical protein
VILPFIAVSFAGAMFCGVKSGFLTGSRSTISPVSSQDQKIQSVKILESRY